MNKICRITNHFDIKNKSDKILSCSIFPMKTSYRDFNKYVDGLNLTITGFQKEFEGKLKLRVYFDSKIKDKILNKELLNNNFVELVEYHCPDFIKDDFHIGTFGTLIRLMPFFDSSYKFIGITDIDLSEQEIKFFSEYYKLSMNSKSDFSFINLMGYHLRYNRDFLVGKIGNVALAQVCIKNPYLDSNLMINFFNEVMQEKSKFKNILNALYEKRKHKEQGISLDSSYPMLYGIDEYFINKVLLDKYLADNKNVDCLVLRDWAINYIIYKLHQKINIQNVNNDQFKFLNIVDSDEEYINNKNKFLEYRTKLIKKIETTQKLYYNLRFNRYYLSLKRQNDYFYKFQDKVSNYDPNIFKLRKHDFLTQQVFKQY